MSLPRRSDQLRKLLKHRDASLVTNCSLHVHMESVLQLGTDALGAARQNAVRSPNPKQNIWRKAKAPEAS